MDVTGTPASPYFVHHPSAPGTPQHTVIFFPGGNGIRPIARVVWMNWLSASRLPDDVRVVVPYSLTDWPSESARAIDILDEVLACYGGDPDHVHLAGTSFGGNAAFNLLLGDTGTRTRFASLLGAPGVFTSGSADEQVSAVEGMAVFNGVGENDVEPWPSSVRSLHALLEMNGVDSRLEVFPSEGHILSAGFDETIFYEFWASN